MKSPKLLIVIGGFCLLLLIGLAWMSAKQPNVSKTKASNAGQPVFDVASGDTNNEVLRTVLARQEQLERRDKKLQKENESLQKQHTSTMQTAIAKITNQLEKKFIAAKQALENQFHDKQQKSEKNFGEHPKNNSGYLIDGTSDGMKNKTHIIVSIPDVSHTEVIAEDSQRDEVTSNPKKGISSYVDLKTEFANREAGKASVLQNGEGKKTIPYYTIPANSTLNNVALMSAIIGEVPVSGHLLAPAFPFKAIIGRRDLFAANGSSLPPEISGMVLEGYSVGNMTLSCARAYVTRSLFVFNDGHFMVFPEKNNNENATQLYPTNALGYLSDSYGNTCIRGRYNTNAPKVLANLIGISTAGGLGQAIAQAQTTTLSNAFQANTIVSGNLAKYAGGMALGNTSKEVLNWYLNRVAGVFDAVYIPASYHHRLTHLVLCVTQTIPIDLNPKGRTLRYEHQTNFSNNSRRLD